MTTPDMTTPGVTAPGAPPGTTSPGRGPGPAVPGQAAPGSHILDRNGQALPVADLVHLWPLGGWHSLEHVPGGKNEHYRLRAADGVFYLRRSHRSKARPELAAQLELMRMLRLRGLPVPLPYPTRSGHDHAVVDGRFWTVTRAIAGRRFDDASEEHLRQLGRTLGRYHRLTEDLDAGEGDPGLLTELRARQADPGLPPEVSARAAEVITRLAGLAPDLPRAVVHGGARRGSLVFQRDRVVGVLDFDSAHADVRVLDLAVAAHDVGKVYTEHGASDHKVRIDLHRVHALLAAYTEVRSLHPVESAALPVFLEAKRLKRALGRMRRDHAGEPLSANDHAKIELEVRRLAWLDTYREELTQICTAAAR
ncbi:phosphotransferase [Nocardioides sp. WL0053]|uniref:Phosphotransferase n=1 Tax=Nocardioides jiangsuensis TaxID=2866161 RepID=A0ABS7RJH9_9ACTN|nr:phosphotransferase [Nocardioides jiangsuensis]MBY9073990.1 phosphotransferase [Nocardioides jiangsuensis]